MQILKYTTSIHQPSIIILFILFCCLTTISSSQLQSLLFLQTSPQITMSYYSSSSSTPTIPSIVSIYSNNTLNSTFIQNHNKFSCANQNIFTYNQTSQQYQQNQIYNISFINFTNLLYISIISQYNNIHPTPQSTNCSKQCTVQISNNCNNQQQSDIIIISVTDQHHLNIKFIYNVICDINKLANPFEWGKLILAVMVTISIFIFAQFQQSKSVYNIGHQVNRYTIVIYCSFVFIGSTFIIIDVADTLSIITYSCLLGSIIFGVVGLMVCCCQFMFWLNIKCFRSLLISNKSIKIRVMDVIGIIVGIGFMCAWYFTGTNWIIGDFICLCILLTTIKIIKFGSLRIAIITFAVTSILDVVFIILAQIMNGVYFNNAMLTVFNNPLFLVMPSLVHYPNRCCSWFFLFSIAYPGIVLSYLYRYDCSRSSKVYSVLFFIFYTLCLVAWVILDLHAAFTLPFNILTVPFSLLAILLYSNRRGQFKPIWQGQFYDELYKHQRQQLRQVSQNIKRQQSPSQLTYNKSLFQGLKYNHSQLENQSQRSRATEFSAAPFHFEDKQLKSINK